MNCETGRMISKDELSQISLAQQAKYVPITKEEMTEKQFEDMQVNTKDRTSKLGRKRFKTYNNLRNKPCVCGSGKKFKKCCWNTI